MAVDKLVDSAQLDAALTATANAIRAKTGSSSSLPWNLSTGFQSAVEEIPEGGGSTEAEDGIIDRTISGFYRNNRVSCVSVNAFYACRGLTGIEFGAATTIASNAFGGCTNLETISFPVATSSIANMMFARCSKLRTVYAPMIDTIGTSAFSSCISLEFASFPSVTKVGSSAFLQCYHMTSVSFPVATTIDVYAFMRCSGLTYVELPAATLISGSAFYECTSLDTVSLPAIMSIYTSAFWRCYNLVSLYLLGSSVAYLADSGAFDSTPISNYSASAGRYGSIFVPATLLSSYKAATNWRYLSSRFVGLTDDEIAELRGGTT